MRLIRLLTLLLAFAAWPAAAHLTPNSEIGLEFGRDRIEASVVIPLGELQYAEPTYDKLRSDLRATQWLTAYLLEHLNAYAPDGRRWTTGAPLRQLRLHYDAVIDKVPNHITLLSVKGDFDAGYLEERPALLAVFRQGNTSVAIDRGAASGWRGFVAAIGLGIHHIAEGHDHLLFLIALLLPAPLLAAGRRWGGYAGWRRTLRSLAIIVTAFTLGHSLTLIGGAFLGWELPAQPVEILIAVSILVSAIHAWRPIFPGREAWVAGGFGLVHGLAFATLIGRIGLDPWQKALSILGFNLGIELIQLLVVTAVMPALTLLARTEHYRPFRLALAAIAALAAILWIIERAMGEDFAPAQLVDAALGYTPWLFLLALSLSAALLAWRRIRPASRTY